MLKFTVGRTYSEITPESAEIGDFSDTGWVYEPRELTLRELLHELEDCSRLSSSPIRKPSDCHVGLWADTDSYTSCYRTGTERSESVHISAVNGHDPKPSQLWRIYKLAGLIKG